MEDKIQLLKEKIMQKPDLVINRVPKNTKQRFLDLASDDEFSNDYGFALKYLMDFYLGIIPSGIEHLEAEIDNIKSQINEIKTVSQKDNKEKIVLGNGRTIEKVK